jgi:hypothetical protein
MAKHAYIAVKMGPEQFSSLDRLSGIGEQCHKPENQADV